MFDEAGNAISTSDDAVEVVDKVDATVNDEVCPNDEYFPELEKTVKIKCSIQLFPVNNLDIDLFRDSVERYFKQRKDLLIV